MKTGIVLSIFAALVYVVVYSYPGGAAATGGIDGTAASGGGGCGNGCHNSSTTDGTHVELDSAGVSVTSYHAGMAYMVKISATNSSSSSLPKFGFQTTVVKLAGSGSSPVDVGTWGTLPTGVRKTLPGTSGLTETIIEQSGALTATTGTGGTGTTYVESIPWTAPLAGTGSVVVFGVINAVNANGSNSGDKYQVASSVTITEAVAVAPVASVSISQTGGTNPACAGISLTFTATATNGGSSPTYQWKVNGTNAGTGATFITSTLTTGSVITCVMTSNLSGVTGSPATSNSITVTINASVTPSVSITSTGNTICSGQSVTFTAAATNGGSTPTYQWYKNGSPISGATSPTYSSLSLSNSDAINVELTSNAQCASPLIVTSNTITISVSASVTPSVSIVSNSGNSICAGQSATFTATPLNGGSTPAYQWLKNGGNIGGATSATYTTTTIANGDVISVQITSNASCLTTTTAISNTITMSTVTNATPSVTISSGSGNTICSGQSVTFTATPVNGGTTPTYQWLKNGSNISGATSSTYASSNLATGDMISVSMTSNSLCVSSNEAGSNAITITVSPTSTPSVSIVSGAGNNVCSGQSVTFTSTPVNGGTALYQWLKNNVAINGATNSSYTTSALVNGDIISLDMTSSLSCAVPASVTSNSVTMSVAVGATASVNISSSNGTTFCTGQANATFTAAPVNGGSSPSYQWTLDGNNIPGANGATYAPTSISDGDIIGVNMTSNSSCVSQSQVSSPPLTLTVSTGGAAIVSISADNGLNVCQGASATFTATAVNAGSSPTYQWQKNGANVGGNIANYTDAALINGDVISCSMTSSLSCASPSTAISNDLPMNVFPLPPASISDSTGVLVASPASFYQWYYNNIAINGATSQTLVPPTSGSYGVKITDAHGCQGYASGYNVTATDIADVSGVLEIAVYPNPTDGMVYLDFNRTGTNEIISSVYDINGRLLLENNYDPSSGRKIALDLHTLQSGVYFLHLIQDAQSAYRKIIVGKQ